MNKGHVGVKLRYFINNQGLKQKRRYYYCSICWYESPYLGTIQKHMAERHNTQLDQFLGEIT